MSESGEVAEQVVRMGIHGAEACLRLTGVAAERLAVLIYAIMKDQHRTAGKIRLESMLKSGKELNVFTLPARDLSWFALEAKRYGVLYCVLKEKETGLDGTVDVMVYNDDAAKINRIVERISISTVRTENADGKAEAEKTTENPTKAGPEESSRSGDTSRTSGKTGAGTPEPSRRSVRKDIEDLRKARGGGFIKEADEKLKGPFHIGLDKPPKSIIDGRAK